jgi:tryptophanyl-tRNA synthetase
MSKSYDNTIPLFASPKELKKLILSIVTDSRAPGEPKDTLGSALYELHRAFAPRHASEEFARGFERGIAWGEAKEIAFKTIDDEIAPMREKYQELMAKPDEIEAILRQGAAKARTIATPLMETLREAVGLRDLGKQVGAKAAAKSKSAQPQFKQYRESDGRFHFKLVAADGRELLHGLAHASPREAGESIARLKRDGAAGLREIAGAGLHLGGELVGELAADAALEQVVEALSTFAEEGL